MIAKMLNRLSVAILLGMSLASDITPGYLTSTLRVITQAPIVVAAMTEGRISPASDKDTTELNPLAAKAAVPVQTAFQDIPQPSVSVTHAAVKFAATTEALGLTDRATIDEAFDVSSIAADDSLASLVDVTRASAPFFGLPGHDVGFGTPETFAQASERGNVSGEFSPGTWRLDVHPSGGIHITAASALPTPLQEFGVAPDGGVDVRIPGGLEVISTSLGVYVFQHVTVSPAEAFAGITPVGPLASLQFSDDAASARITALLSDGQVLTAAALTLRAGDVSVAYVTGPGGSSLSGHLINGPVDFTLSLSGSEPQLSLLYTLRGGQIARVSWSANGFQVGLSALVVE